MVRSKCTGKGVFNVLKNKGNIKKEINQINERIKHEHRLTLSMVKSIDKLNGILANRKEGGIVVAASLAAAKAGTVAFLKTKAGKIVLKGLAHAAPIVLNAVLGGLKDRHDEVQKLTDLRKEMKRREQHARKGTLNVVSKVMVLNEKVGRPTKDVQNNYHLGKLRQARL